MTRKIYLISSSALLLILFLTYLKTLQFDYVWDDVALFLDNSGLRNPTDLWEALSKSILPGTTYFRPAVLLSFILEFKLFGATPTYSHLINVLLLALNTLLTGTLALRLAAYSHQTKKYAFSLLSMAIYGLHPSLVEPTVWVAGRFDLLCTSFFLLALVSFYHLKGITKNILIGAFFFLALCSKEMAITLPAIIFTLIFAENKIVKPRKLEPIELLKENKPLIISITLSLLAYLAIRYQAHPNLLVANQSLQAELSPIQKVSFISYSLEFYVRMTFLPFLDINPMHPFDVRDRSISQNILSIVGLICFLSLALWAALKRPLKITTALLISYLISLAPVLNILPLNIGGNLGHERFLTLPLVFASIAASSVIIDIAKARKAAAALFLIGWLFIAFATTATTIPLWRNEFSLWYWAYEKHPNLKFVQFNYLSSAIFMGQLETAERALEQIKSTHEELGRLKAVEGQLQVRQGNYKEAIKTLNMALEGEYQPHLEVQSKGIPLPQTTIVRDNVQNAWLLRYIYGSLAEAYLKSGNYPEALANLEIVEFYGPGYPVVSLMRSLAEYGLGNTEEGNRQFEKAEAEFAPKFMPQVRKAREDFLENNKLHSSKALEDILKSTTPK
ncbi:hypothetical protein [uncultured Pseudomonas sp.]|uniref:tetratricopeptide repeat protein n=1 Tax=uncultured Pseudomonas sp. TaxID=114707 RepID=UPI0025DFC41D|nr:hypothetical protein [uncultured Pseudomonas sp.]